MAYKYKKTIKKGTYKEQHDVECEQWMELCDIMSTLNDMRYPEDEDEEHVDIVH